MAVLSLLAMTALALPLHAQDLTPRAYLITPTGSHAVTLSSSFSNGHVLVDPSVPLEDGSGTFQVAALGYYQSFNLLGRSSNITLVVPYARGNFQGTLQGVGLRAYRSGLAVGRIRMAVNLRGGRAMNLGEYLKWREKRLLGVSLTVTIPSGQYDPARVVNTSTHRWGFKPEAGFTRRWSHWVADWYMGAWFFTTNHEFFPGQSRRRQKPAAAVEGHLGYYARPRLWLSLDANFWAGNRSVVNGVEKQDQQRDSRIGGTLSIPITQGHAAKFSYSQGAYVTIGGAFRTVSVAWQYSWISSPR
jgi:hypothetical protein